MVLKSFNPQKKHLEALVTGVRATCVLSHDAKNLCRESSEKEANGLGALGRADQLDCLLS